MFFFLLEYDKTSGVWFCHCKLYQMFAMNSFRISFLFLLQMIISHLHGVESSDCVKCTYLNWNPWEKCNATTECGKQLRRRVRALCCPTFITGPNVIDRCASHCNITNHWQEFLNDDPSKCHCYAQKLETCCNGKWWFKQQSSFLHELSFILFLI